VWEFLEEGRVTGPDEVLSGGAEIDRAFTALGERRQFRDILPCTLLRLT
jgi:hypothetical protein